MEGLRRIKLLHCGDLHLDAPFTSLADREGGPEQRRQDLKRALTAIIDLADAEKVDLLLVCGDLYEHGYVRKSTIHFIGEQFRRLGNIPVLVIPGNHDPAAPDSFYCSFEWPDNVTILKNDRDYFEHAATGTRVFCRIPEDGTPVCGNGARAGALSVNSAAGAEGNKPAAAAGRAGINILMWHGTLDMPFSTDAYQPVSSLDLEKAGFDYCALGHFHSTIRGAGRSKRIYNTGSPEPLGFDEEGEHGAFLVTIEKPEQEDSRVFVDFRKLCRRQYVSLDVQAEGCLTDEQAAASVASALEGAGGREDLYRVSLQGYVNRSYRPDTGYIAELLREKAFYIKIVDNTAPDYDFDLLVREPGLRGLFARKMLDRAAGAPDEESRRLALRALYYGMEAIDEGRVCI